MDMSQAYETLYEAVEHNSHEVTVSVEVAKEALFAMRRQLSRVPVMSEHYQSFCPECGKHIQFVPNTHRCPFCGQRLDWATYNEQEREAIAAEDAECEAESKFLAEAEQAEDDYVDRVIWEHSGFTVE